MKSIVVALFITLLLILLNGTAFPDMQEGIRLEANGKPIDADVGHLVPCVADWNNDGKKDLLMGQFIGGKISLYINHGTDNDPEFKDSTYLHAGGKEINLPAG